MVEDSPLNWAWTLERTRGPDVDQEIIANGGSRAGAYSLEENLFTVPTNRLVNTTFTNFTLIVRLGFSGNCGDDDYVPKEGRLNFSFEKVLYFSIDNVNGEPPDIVGDGCTVPVAALQVEMEILLMPPNSNETCAVLNTASQPVKKCAFRIDDTVADKVAARMLNESRCEGQSWPNVKGLLEQCKLSKQRH